MDNEKNNGDRKQRSEETKKKIKKIQLCLLIFGAIVLVLYAISGLLVAISKKPVQEAYQITKTNIPIPDMLLQFNYKFNITCQYVYMDNTVGPADDCQSAIQQPTDNQSGKYQARLITRDFSKPDMPQLNYSLPDRRFGIKFAIRLNDGSYNYSQDQGMFAYAVDPELDPYTLPDSTRKVINKIDSNFFKSLNSSNAALVGSFEDTYMVVKRHLLRRPYPTWLWVTWIGIPAKMFDIYYFTSKSESLTTPEFVTNVLNQTNPLYANLLVVNYDWFVDARLETRVNDFWHLLALIAAFTILLIGIYACCLGDLRHRPFGLCHVCCCKKAIKEDLRGRYRAGVPLIGKEDEDADIIKRINNLEAFMNEHLVGNDFMRTKQRKQTDEQRLLGDPASGNSSSITSSLPKPVDNANQPLMRTDIEEQTSAPPLDEFAPGDTIEDLNAPPTGAGQRPKRTAPSNGQFAPDDNIEALNDLPIGSGQRPKKTAPSSEPLAPGDNTEALSNLPIGSGQRPKRTAPSSKSSAPPIGVGKLPPDVNMEIDSTLYGDAAIVEEFLKTTERQSVQKVAKEGQTGLQISEHRKNIMKHEEIEEHYVNPSARKTGINESRSLVKSFGSMDEQRVSIISDSSTLQGSGSQFGERRESVLTVHSETAPKEITKTEEIIKYVDVDGDNEVEIDESELEKGEYEVISEEVIIETTTEVI